MNDQSKNLDDLMKENEELRQRLVDCEAEKTAARERADFLQELIDSCDDTIQLIGLDGKVKFTSLSFERHSGYTIQEISSIQLASIYPPDEIGRGAELMRRLMSSPVGTAIRAKHSFYHKDGRLVFLESSMVNRLDEPLKGIVGVTRILSDEAHPSSAWQEAQEVLLGVFGGIHDAVFIHDSQGTIVQVNHRAEELFGLGYTVQMLSVPVGECYWLEPRSTKMSQVWQEIMSTGKNRLSEGKGRRLSDGTVFDAEIYLSPIQLQGQDCILATVRDITERKRQEQMLKDSLAEKEALLRELHHRVKNNFAVMASLLRLQYRRIKDQAIMNVLKETEFRVKCMGLVHEKLHQSESLESLKVNDYLQSLTNNLIDVYGCDERRIRIRTDLDRVSFGADTAIPLGFITSELVSNALKHAFPEGNGGEITVSLTQIPETRKFELTISDNGKGLPENMEISTLPSLGLNLVTTFARQIGADLRIESESGTTFRLVFEVDDSTRRAA